MNKTSAGILLYRIQNDHIELLLVHPGGPFWKNKDEGAWSIPKGEYTAEEDPLAAALRELAEETGINVKKDICVPLSPVKQKSGKLVLAWAMKGDLDINKIKSNMFEMEYPARSGKIKSFPEIDKAAWFSISMAKGKINTAQISLIDELVKKLETGEII